MNMNQVLTVQAQETHYKSVEQPAHKTHCTGHGRRDGNGHFLPSLGAHHLGTDQER